MSVSNEIFNQYNTKFYIMGLGNRYTGGTNEVSVFTNSFDVDNGKFEMGYSFPTQTFGIYHYLFYDGINNLSYSFTDTTHKNGKYYAIATLYIGFDVHSTPLQQIIFDSTAPTSVYSDTFLSLGFIRELQPTNKVVQICHLSTNTEKLYSIDFNANSVNCIISNTQPNIASIFSNRSLYSPYQSGNYIYVLGVSTGGYALAYTFTIWKYDNNYNLIWSQDLGTGLTAVTIPRVSDLKFFNGNIFLGMDINGGSYGNQSFSGTANIMIKLDDATGVYKQVLDLIDNPQNPTQIFTKFNTSLNQIIVTGYNPGSKINLGGIIPTSDGYFVARYDYDFSK